MVTNTGPCSLKKCLAFLYAILIYLCSHTSLCFKSFCVTLYLFSSHFFSFRNSIRLVKQDGARMSQRK